MSWELILSVSLVYARYPREAEEHGFIPGRVHGWRGGNTLPLQGVPVPAVYDEFSESHRHRAVKLSNIEDFKCYKLQFIRMAGVTSLLFFEPTDSSPLGRLCLLNSSSCFLPLGPDSSHIHTNLLLSSKCITHPLQQLRLYKWAPRPCHAWKNTLKKVYFLKDRKNPGEQNNKCIEDGRATQSETCTWCFDGYWSYHTGNQLF